MRRQICYRAIIYLVTLFCSADLIAQSNGNGLGSWSVLNVEMKLNDKFSAFIEGQLRSEKFYNDFFYHEQKGGISYSASKNVEFLVGSGQYATYASGGNFKSPVSNHEFRLWEQLTIKNDLKRLKLEHRYRIEQRFRSDGYRNRFRYRLNAIVPINNTSVVNGTLFTSIYNEIFLTDKGPYFERNRFFGGLGYQISRTLTLQTGFLRQFDYSKDSKSSKDFLQTSIYISLRDKDTEGGRHPSTID